jgi:predicted transport protein
MQITKPSDSIREHLTNIHLSEKTNLDYVTSSNFKYSKYVPTKEEVIQIAKLIEKVSGMKIDERFRKGDVKIELVTKEEAEKTVRADLYDILEGLHLEPRIHNNIYKNYIKNSEVIDKGCNAYFNERHSTVYLIYDNTEKSVKESSVNLVEAGKIDGKIERHFFRKTVDQQTLEKIWRYFMLSITIHEVTHGISFKNNSELANVRLNGQAELLKIESEIQKSNDPKRIRILDHSMKAKKRQVEAYMVYGEAIAHRTENLVMNELDYDKLSNLFLEVIKSNQSNIAAGLEFLEAVERTTHQNPVAFTIHDPPKSMLEIENHKVYLRRSRGWRV